MSTLNTRPFYGNMQSLTPSRRNRRSGLKFFDSADWVMNGSSGNMEPIDKRKIENIRTQEKCVHGSPLKSHDDKY